MFQKESNFLEKTYKGNENTNGWLNLLKLKWIIIKIDIK